MDHSFDQNTVPDIGQSNSAAPASRPSRDQESFAQSSVDGRDDSPPSRPAEARTRTRWVWGACGLLLLAVGLVFGQTLGHDFIGCDDEVYVYQNPHVTPGLTAAGFWWALTDGPFGEWYPLTMLSHMLDCQLYGLSPGWHYLTNVVLHGASAVLLLLVLLRMTGDLWPSAWVAAVFAIHPLHVESVAWLAERRDVLSGLFFVLTLGAYTLYAERRSIGRYLAVAGCLALGLMAKPTLVTVPFLLLLLDYWPLGRFGAAAGAAKTESGSWLARVPRFWMLVVEKIPLVALAAASCAVVLSTHATMQPDAYEERLSPAALLANALVACAAYVGQSFYPVDLSAYYPHLGSRLPLASIATSLVVLLAITAVAIYGWRRWPYLAVGWFWFLGMLVPVIGLVPNGPHGRADRYTYLSQIGLSMALAWCVRSVYRSSPSRGEVAWRRWTLAAAAWATIILLAAVAWRQTSYWRSAETLWTHALACNTQNRMAHSSLGAFYLGQGQTSDAIEHARQALDVPAIDRQLIAKSQCLLGDCLTKQGNIDLALTHYQQAVDKLPSAPIFHERLAVALASRGQQDRAIAEWREVIRLDPNHLQAHLGLADTSLAHGDTSEAIAECNEILKREPGSVEAMVILGAALAAEGMYQEGIPRLRRAVQLRPDNAAAHFQLGVALYGRGLPGSAITHFNKALELRPGNAATLWQAAWILATCPDPVVRDPARAVDLAKRAIERSGGEELRAFDALAAALAATGEFSAAIETAEQASAMAQASGDAALADAIDQRTLLYRQGLPYQQPASRASTGQARPAGRERTSSPPAAD
ncbi:MAG TPA: tetratricopeptide repeat protein [Pirellulales bacterium]|nr:tetratricopeptide repeat protein [Pirellulales bacterium]